MKNLNWKLLLTSIGISLGTGILAGLLTSRGMQLYEDMYHPPLAPPGWLFPIVWTILYVLMGTAAYLIYQTDSEKKSQALTTYAFQLVVNFGWPIIFFGFQAYLLAFAWLILLWYLIFMTIRQFMEISPLAAKLLYPYLAWVTFAAYLNLAIAIQSLTK